MSESEKRFVEISGGRLHYQRFGERAEGGPIVFLHEGLGSVDLWRDFPAAVVAATARPGLVYSRYGNGWSDPLDGARGTDYMHTEALEVLPRVLDRLTDGQPPILVGHSDGASIALIYAGAGYQVKGLVLMAPHVFVEPEGLASISALRDEFTTSDMPEKMAKYHTDPERTFYGWADIWLSPCFRSWNIEEYVAGVRCPTLLIQGDADEYGTTRQLDAVEAGLNGAGTRLIIEDAGHSPHLSHPDPVIEAVVGFVNQLG